MKVIDADKLLKWLEERREDAYINTSSSTSGEWSSGELSAFREVIEFVKKTGQL